MGGGVRDVVDGDRSFGDIGRQHDLGQESGAQGLGPGTWSMPE